MRAICFCLTNCSTKRLTRDNSIICDPVFLNRAIQLGSGCSPPVTMAISPWPNLPALRFLVLVGCAGLLAHSA